jgi:hypothetical protein
MVSNILNFFQSYWNPVKEKYENEEQQIVSLMTGQYENEVRKIPLDPENKSTGFDEMHWQSLKGIEQNTYHRNKIYQLKPGYLWMQMKEKRIEILWHESPGWIHRAFFNAKQTDICIKSYRPHIHKMPEMFFKEIPIPSFQEIIGKYLEKTLPYKPLMAIPRIMNTQKKSLKNFQNVLESLDIEAHLTVDAQKKISLFVPKLSSKRLKIQIVLGMDESLQKPFNIKSHEYAGIPLVHICYQFIDVGFFQHQQERKSERKMSDSIINFPYDNLLKYNFCQESSSTGVLYTDPEFTFTDLSSLEEETYNCLSNHQIVDLRPWLIVDPHSEVIYYQEIQKEILPSRDDQEKIFFYIDYKDSWKISSQFFVSREKLT